MRTEPNQNISNFGAANRVLFVINLLMLVGVVFYILIRRQWFQENLDDYDVDLPWTTWIVINTPRWMLLSLSGIFFLFLAGKEILFGWKTLRLGLNVVCFLLLILSLIAFQESMLLPLFDLLEDQQFNYLRN